MNEIRRNPRDIIKVLRKEKKTKINITKTLNTLSKNINSPKK